MELKSTVTVEATTDQAVVFTAGVLVFEAVRATSHS